MILIDYSDRRPIYEQVTEKIAELIIRGVLPPESQLPSVRSLAMDLSINPNTIQRAYQELERKGYTYSVPGKGSFVSQKTEYLEEQRENILEEQRRLAEKAMCLGMDPRLLKEVIDQCEGGEKA
ncbi:GntR family transcriptional regulator [Lachnoclostridium sp. An196]|uniref:GntR family transcriptional regulator n=1 Tax=Lachnoclostridium sp. An196 TaxID=1965583 RepID=UPI000B3A07F7|nr:GntR family transcriptional regulator [Lachnoclostridium sp. An196]OUP16217.1 GntR family transcriptional regulator [Lachnoclostridium sp. An196]